MFSGLRSGSIGAVEGENVRTARSKRAVRTGCVFFFYLADELDIQSCFITRLDQYSG
jgi:hypothetical protein